jgi:hypothetical protein
LLKSAMTEALADLDGNPNDRHQRLYRTWAQGGVGLQITGNVMIDRRYLERSGNVIFDGRTELGAIRQWSAAAQEGGTLALVQLNHPGRQTTRFVTSRPIAPSAGPAVSTLKSFARPRAMTEREVRETIERYADAAELAELGGFDGVQIHAAHGYLISQFLSPLTNQRNDEWGGSPERRRRFLIEVIRTVRARTRANFIVGVKLNSADFQRGGFDEAESMAVVDDLAKEAIRFPGGLRRQLRGHRVFWLGHPGSHPGPRGLLLRIRPSGEGPSARSPDRVDRGPADPFGLGGGLAGGRRRSARAGPDLVPGARSAPAIFGRERRRRLAPFGPLASRQVAGRFGGRGLVWGPTEAPRGRQGPRPRDRGVGRFFGSVERRRLARDRPPGVGGGQPRSTQ